MAYVTAGNRRGGRILILNNFRYVRNRAAKTGMFDHFEQSLHGYPVDLYQVHNWTERIVYLLNSFVTWLFKVKLMPFRVTIWIIDLRPSVDPVPLRGRRMAICIWNSRLSTTRNHLLALWQVVGVATAAILKMATSTRKSRIYGREWLPKRTLWWNISGANDVSWAVW